MLWTDTIVRRGALALALLAGLGGTALAETLVVRSGGPSAKNYPAGKALAANARITLQAGDTLTVLDSKGTRMLRGPGTFDAEADAGARTSTSLAALVSTQNRRRARTGAVRADGRPARPANVWHVDVTRSTTMCVANPATVQLWRPKIDGAMTVTVRDETTGKSGEITFRAGYQEVSWPVATLPVAEGSRFTLSVPGAAEPSRIRFTLVNADGTDLVGVYRALDTHGCAAQRDLMVESMDAESQSKSASDDRRRLGHAPGRSGGGLALNRHR